jgi:hypothetical protein
LHLPHWPAVPSTCPGRRAGACAGGWQRFLPGTRAAPQEPAAHIAGRASSLARRRQTCPTRPSGSAPPPQLHLAPPGCRRR